ncbi:MAG: two-component regulator propeller domain-containing protein [Halieaceae bacterium]
MNSFRLEIFLRPLIVTAIFLTAPDIFAKSTPSVFLPNHVSQTLGDQTISSILWHKKNLWIGTQNGLYIYDGRNLKMPTENIDNIGPFFGSHITSLVTSSEGDIWISSINHGVVQYDVDSESFSRPLEIDKSILVSSVSVDRHGNLWIGSDRGAYRVDLSLDNDHKKRSLSRPTIEAENISGIIEDDLGFTWITSDEGVYVYNNSRNTTENFCLSKSVACNSVSSEYTAIHLGAKGAVYIGSANGLLHAIDIRTRKVQLIYNTKVHGTNYITSILENKDTIWIGTDEGLVEIDIASGDGEFLDIDNSGLGNDHITKISHGENGTWIGTYKGLNLVITPPIINYNFRNSQIFNEVLSFAEDENNQIFVGTYQGVYSFDKNTSMHELLPMNGTENNKQKFRSMSVAVDSNVLYVGTRGSGIKLHHFDNRTQKSIELGLGSASITKMHMDKAGNLWVGTFNHGLLQVRPTNNGVSKVAPKLLLSPKNGPVTSISSALNKKLLVATETRIFQIDYAEEKEVDIDFRFADLELRPVILSAKMDDNGAIWIGTLSSGLYRLPKNESVAEVVRVREGPYKSKQGFSVYEIQIDSLGGVWCGTSEGVHKFGIDAVYIGRLGVNDGLQGNTFNFGASFTDSQGFLYFGGSNGYNKFHPSDITFLHVDPEMTLSSVSINGKSEAGQQKLEYLENIVLTHRESNLQIQFHIEDYFSPHEAIYLHQLKPLEPALNRTVGHGSATYTNLPPGEYSFHAQGTDSSGNTNTEGIQLKVIVLPAPWRTWWAYTLYVLIAAGFLWAVWRWYYMYIMKQRAIAYAREMNAEAESAIDELQEQLDVQDALVNTVHRRNIATLDILDSLNQVSESVIEEAKQTHSQRSIAALKSLENSLLYQHDHLYADLHRCTDDITNSLLAESDPNGGSISIINDVTNKPIDAEVGALLSIAISELAHNSMVHAFTGRALGNFIKITLQVTEQPDQGSAHYKLSINDNGIGLPDNFLNAATEGVRILTLIRDSLNGELSRPGGTGSEVILTFTKTSFETE